MDGETPAARSRAVLQDTPETAERFYRYGLNGYSQLRMSIEEGVHRNTIYNFLKVAPLSRGRFEDGKAERREARRLSGLADAAAARDAAMSGAADICPTCGQRIGFSDETVTFTTAEITDARREFEDLIDRHLAARRAASPEA